MCYVLSYLLSEVIFELTTCTVNTLVTWGFYKLYYKEWNFNGLLKCGSFTLKILYVMLNVLCSIFYEKLCQMIYDIMAVNNYYVSSTLHGSKSEQL